MNEELFKRLQDQCWIYHTHPDMIDTEGRPCGFDTKKFAELLVRECIRLCDQVDIVGADECIDNIKEHFGVEE